MNIAIYGAGSLGTILGAYITRKGIAVDLISRNTTHVTGLKRNGARVVGTVDMVVPVSALLPEDVSKKYDIVFLLTKTIDNTSTIRSCASILAPDGIICTMQNGLPEADVAEVIGESRTFGCAIAWGATMLGNGVCELTSEPDSITFSLGGWSANSDSQRIGQIKRILESMGRVEVESNFAGARWSKLLINASFSGMSAVLGCTFGEAAANKTSRRCIQRIIKECIDVSRRAGVRLEPVQGKDIAKLFDYRSKLKEHVAFQLIPLAIRKHRKLKASMLQDIEKGKRCEVDAINGTVSRFGNQHQVPTPYNDMVVRIIHEIERGKLKPGFENLHRFEDLR